ncbi:MAG: hypothetical protein IJ929_07605 [Prevotella sp.]|jgi:hypothetical protein|nr:hypothetical protein [Prevotella sp.]
MKKTYMKPTTKVVELRKPTLLAGSITDTGNGLRVTFDDAGDFEDNEIN